MAMLLMLLLPWPGSVAVPWEVEDPSGLRIGHVLSGGA